MKSTLRILLKSLFYLFLISMITLSIVVIFAFQSTPLVKQTHVIDADTAKLSKEAISRVVRSFKNQKTATVVTLTKQDLTSISALANRSVPNLSTDIELQPSEVEASMSYRLPFPSYFRYLNVSAVLYSSDFGLVFGDVTIGSIKIPGNWLVKLTQWGLNLVAKSELGDKVFSTVEWVTIDKHQMLFGVKLPDEFNQLRVDGKSSLIALRDQFELFGEVDKVKKYYLHVTSITDKNNKITLPALLRELFIYTHKQSALFTNDELVEENRSALTALVIYLGSKKFELVVGDISTLTAKQTKTRDQLRSSLTLHNRVDLQKHFIYSIALQLFSSQAASDAIGEMKEFIDSNKGGTGFSFTDLLADRTGTTFAQLATEPSSARLFQQRVKYIFSEKELIPSITDLTEGISKQQFESEYKNIQSQEYNEMLADIDGRIAELVLYQQP